MGIERFLHRKRHQPTERAIPEKLILTMERARELTPKYEQFVLENVIPVNTTIEQVSDILIPKITPIVASLKETEEIRRDNPDFTANAAFWTTEEENSTLMENGVEGFLGDKLFNNFNGILYKRAMDVLGPEKLDDYDKYDDDGELPDRDPNKKANAVFANEDLFSKDQLEQLNQKFYNDVKSYDWVGRNWIKAHWFVNRLSYLVATAITEEAITGDADNRFYKLLKIYAAGAFDAEFIDSSDHWNSALMQNHFTADFATNLYAHRFFINARQENLTEKLFACVDFPPTPENEQKVFGHCIDDVCSERKLLLLPNR